MSLFCVCLAPTLRNCSTAGEKKTQPSLEVGVAVFLATGCTERCTLARRAVLIRCSKYMSLNDESRPNEAERLTPPRMPGWMCYSRV